MRHILGWNFRRSELTYPHLVHVALMGAFSITIGVGDLETGGVGWGLWGHVATGAVLLGTCIAGLTFRRRHGLPEPEPRRDGESRWDDRLG